MQELITMPTPLAFGAAPLRGRIERIAVFAELPSALLDAIASRCPLRELAAGAAVLTAGESNDRMFVVLQGCLSVHLGDGTAPSVAELRTGDTVGELSAIDQRPASATVIARTDSTLLAIDEAMFWHICHASHVFSLRLMRTLVQKLRDSNHGMQAKIEQCANLKAVSERDALTGAQSRRWLDETLPGMCQDHRRDGTALCIAVVDVDHFKRINDTHGHQAGDRVLRELATLLRAHLRPTDFVARFGGEEFVIVLPFAPLTGARVAAERIRDAVSRALIRHDAETPALQLTVSIGLAELGSVDDEASMFAQADAALYRAKRNGRNRIEL